MRRSLVLVALIGVAALAAFAFVYAGDDKSKGTCHHGKCFLDSKDVKFEVENIDKGVKITVTSEKDEVVKKIQEHFAKIGKGDTKCKGKYDKSCKHGDKCKGKCDGKCKCGDGCKGKCGDDCKGKCGDGCKGKCGDDCKGKCGDGCKGKCDDKCKGKCDKDRENCPGHKSQ